MNSEVILFGSRARGNHRADSDWDFLVLIDEAQISRELKNEVIDHLYEIELETDSVIVPIVLTRHEWNDQQVTPLYKIIQSEGIAA